jgi:hypothetical protein
MERQTVITKKRGPAPTGKGTLVGVRLQPDQLLALDAWIELQPDPRPTRPEAIRRLLKQSLVDASVLQATHDGMDAWDLAVSRSDEAEKKRKGR